jgi:hypothetical protein
MLPALLLPLFLTAAPGEPAIQLWISNDGRFLTGEHARIQVRTKDAGYLLVLHADPDGRLRVLFPLNPGDNNFVQGGERYELKDGDGSEAFLVEASSGRGMVYAAVSTSPFRFDEYRQIDFWDNQALAPSALSPDSESELTELVRDMAQADFDYDVVTYDVVDPVVYPSQDGVDTSDMFVSDESYYGWYGGSPFFAGCSGFFFDPFFQCPVFFSPFVNEPAMITRFFPRAYFPGSPPAATPYRNRGYQAAVANWPVDVSPGSSALATMARRSDWPVDASPRLRAPTAATGPRTMSSYAGGPAPRMEPGRLSEGRRIANRAGIGAPTLERRGGFSGSARQMGPGLRSFGAPHAAPSMRGAFMFRSR